MQLNMLYICVHTTYIVCIICHVGMADIIVVFKHGVMSKEYFNFISISY